MYKLLGNPKTRAGRVMWMLEELGVDYDINPVARMILPSRLLIRQVRFPR